MEAAQNTGAPSSRSDAWRKIWRLLHEMGGLLDEMMDADADAEVSGGMLPAAAVGECAADLARRLRAAFAQEEAETWPELLAEAPQFGEQVRRLEAEHAVLLQRLNEVLELVGSPARPVASWRDVAASFRRFAVSLVGHDRREADLSQRAICDDVGVGD